MPGKIDTMKKRGTPVSDHQASVIAKTVAPVMDGTLFGDPGGDLGRKQQKFEKPLLAVDTIPQMGRGA